MRLKALDENSIEIARLSKKLPKAKGGERERIVRQINYLESLTSDEKYFEKQ